MRTLTCLALILALAACGDDGTATGTATTTGDTGTTQDPSGDPSPTAPSTGQNPTTGDGDDISDAGTMSTDASTSTTTDATATTTTTTTGDPSTTTTTGDPSTTTTDDTTTTGDTDDTTTGGVEGCGLDGPELEATLVHEGAPPPPCGTVEFIGQNVDFDAVGPVYQLDGCPCGSDCFAPDPWTLTLDVPAEALPLQMPICPRVVVQRTMSKQGCELVGVAIWETENDDITRPWYIAGSLLGPIDAVKNDLTLEQLDVETCDCDFCCSPPKRYDLKFTAFGDTATVPEAAQDLLAVPNESVHYDVYNYESHLSGICDDSPDIDWVVSMVLEP